MKQDIFIEGFIGDVGGFFGDTKSFSLSDLNSILNNLPNGVTELDVHINSGGGLITEGFAIHDKLVASGLVVNTIVEGMAGSIATVIAQAGKKGKRKMFENAEYFIHNPSWQPSAPDNYEAQDLQKLADELKKNEEKIAEFYANVTGTNATQIKQRMQEATTLSANEAQKLGFIDEIIHTSINAFTRYRLVALVEKPKQKTMNTNEIEEVKGMFSSLTNGLNKLLNAIAPEKKSFEITLADGSKVYSEVEKPTTGTKLFLDAELTKAYEGSEIELGGEKFTIEAGAIKEAVVPQSPEIEALKKQIEELTAKNAELEAAKGEAVKEATEAKQVVETTKQEVEKVNAEFTALKNKLVTGGFQNFVAPAVEREKKVVLTGLDEAAAKISKALKS